MGGRGLPVPSRLPCAGVVGSGIDLGKEIEERLEPFRGNRYAKGALDAAWWDLKARQEGKPLHAVLGGERQSVAVGPTFDRMDSHEEFLALDRPGVRRRL